MRFVGEPLPIEVIRQGLIDIREEGGEHGCKPGQTRDPEACSRIPALPDWSVARSSSDFVLRAPCQMAGAIWASNPDGRSLGEVGRSVPTSNRLIPLVGRDRWARRGSADGPTRLRSASFGEVLHPGPGLDEAGDLGSVERVVPNEPVSMGRRHGQKKRRPET